MYLWMPPSIRRLSHFTLLFRLYPLARQGGYSCCLRLLHNDVVLRRNPAQTATIFFFQSLLSHLLSCSIRCPIRPTGSWLGIRRGRRASLWEASERAKNPKSTPYLRKPKTLPRCCGEPSDTPDLAATSTPLPLQPRPDNSSTWLPATRRHKSKLD
ncbi:hypothetical protein M440DRAFT_1015912 [Trichoderma longibrachiatum ATCC 18648]|uniref:Uncharacterized protein n=1 Tax=Trichoderma longibrachiatum ATCC 18648 TaxID=983965 RepID=A0A2T4CIR6_TRILO|nr:hypothetical protein M440DRAFT_1015912 [Trichoderma longibrachiatum ATCC 18648]